ncbi:MAG: hypothetical protein ACR2QJ_05050 [Geminicoccaceae bacterium]
MVVDILVSTGNQIAARLAAHHRVSHNSLRHAKTLENDDRLDQVLPHAGVVYERILASLPRTAGYVEGNSLLSGFGISLAIKGFF